MKLEGVMMTKNRFTKMVEDTVRDKRMSYLDTIVYLCEKNNMEIEDVKKYVSPVVKNKVEAEAMSLNFLPKQNVLPL
jgi:hypothetical protein